MDGFRKRMLAILSLIMRSVGEAREGNKPATATYYFKPHYFQPQHLTKPPAALTTQTLQRPTSSTHNR